MSWLTACRASPGEVLGDIAATGRSHCVMVPLQSRPRRGSSWHAGPQARFCNPRRLLPWLGTHTSSYWRQLAAALQSMLPRCHLLCKVAAA